MNVSEVQTKGADKISYLVELRLHKKPGLLAGIFRYYGNKYSYETSRYLRRLATINPAKPAMNNRNADGAGIDTTRLSNELKPPLF